MTFALVTGAAGFLGRYLVEQLVADGTKVRALIRRPDEGLSRLGVEILIADIRDRSAVLAAAEGVDEAYHVAGVTGIWGPWRHFYETNTIGTRHVIDACLKKGVKRLVYTSSPSVIFDGRDQEGVDESVPYPRRWLCHYAHSKALAEQAVLAAHGTLGLATCALRPHLIWGPRDTQLLPRLAESARRGRLVRVGSGNNLIDTVYVENAAAAHRLAAWSLRRAGSGGSVYFISQGNPVRCWVWINELLVVLGLPPATKGVPHWFAWGLGAGLEMVHRLIPGGEPRMTRFLAAQLGRSHFYDISKARRELGYEPAISSAEGVERLRRSLAANPA